MPGLAASCTTAQVVRKQAAYPPELLPQPLLATVLSLLAFEVGSRFSRRHGDEAFGTNRINRAVFIASICELKCIGLSHKTSRNSTKAQICTRGSMRPGAARETVDYSFETPWTEGSILRRKMPAVPHNGGHLITTLALPRRRFRIRDHHAPLIQVLANYRFEVTVDSS